MAELQIVIEDNLYKVKTEGFYFEFPTEGADNRKALILFLRGFKKDSSAKQGLFSQEQIAQAMPDFPGATRKHSIYGGKEVLSS